MYQHTKTLASFLALTLCISFIGCDQAVKSVKDAKVKSDEMSIEKALKESYDIYITYQEIHIHGPESMEKFLEYAEKQKEGSKSIKFVTKAGFKFKWNVKMRDAQDGISNFVLASAPDGRKLMLNGRLQK